MELRLDSFLSKYGVCSRRKAKVLVENGNVWVNGAVVHSIVKVDEDKDVVSIDAKPVKTKNLKYRYIVLNKPVGILSSSKDDRGRKTVLDIVRVPERVYPIGRLDFNSSGLILLTNDGDFALKVTHPRYNIPKKYIVKTEEPLTIGKLDKMRKGVFIEEAKTLPCEIKKMDNKTFEITLHQGLKRQIREMCRAVELTVSELERISIGNLNLGDLKVGEFRDLTEGEVEMLKDLF